VLSPTTVLPGLLQVEAIRGDVVELKSGFVVLTKSADRGDQSVSPGFTDREVRKVATPFSVMVSFPVTSTVAPRLVVAISRTSTPSIRVYPVGIISTLTGWPLVGLM